MADVYYADQICYKNDHDSINQAHSVCFGIINAVRIYQKTFLYQNYAQLKSESLGVKGALDRGKSIFDPDFPAIPYHSTLLGESITDNFLMGTFYEVIAKAFLLNQGILVHKIKSDREAPVAVRNYASNQKTKPVVAKAYVELVPFADYESVGRNGLKYLSPETLNYAWIYEADYLTALPFSERFVSDARIYRSYRNLIHFPLAGASESVMDLDITSEDVIATVNTEIDSTIRPLYMELTKMYSLNFNFTF